MQRPRSHVKTMWFLCTLFGAAALGTLGGLLMMSGGSAAEPTPWPVIISQGVVPGAMMGAVPGFIFGAIIAGITTLVERRDPR